jgi:hypothetical protein
MELGNQSAFVSARAKENRPFPPSRARQVGVFVSVLLVAVALVGALSVLTNRMPARWDEVFYIDMAKNGFSNNPRLTTPFAYRAAIPLVVGTVSRLLHTDPEATFHAAAHVAGVLILVLAYYWTRAFGGSELAGWCGVFALGLNYEVVRYPLFNGGMLDIYGYLFVLMATWGVLRKKFYPVLIFCAMGLFVKEFLIVPLLAQAAVLVVETPRERWRSLIVPLGLTGFAIAFYLVFTRTMIHVSDSLQHIDPQRPETLRYLLTHPISPLRWFNIIYSTLSFWLPVVLLMTRERWQVVRETLRPYRRIITAFALFQLLLIMYGGNNISIFVGYSLGIELLVLLTLVDRGHARAWELVLIFAILVVFNRIGAHIPTYEEGRWDDLLDFYGAFGTEIRARSVLRFFEIWAYVGAFYVIRRFTGAAPSRQTVEFAR